MRFAAGTTGIHEHYIVVARKATNNGLRIENGTVLLKKSQVILEKGLDFRVQSGKGQQIKYCVVELVMKVETWQLRQPGLHYASLCTMLIPAPP